jgi:D-3-phosphoglycerate dehydrogenase
LAAEEGEEGMVKIVIPFGVEMVDEALALMREVAQVSILRDNSDPALRAEARDANAILAGAKPNFDRSLIESAGGLRHIARLGVGVDNIDLKAATEHGVFVTNNPGLTADSVAEFTMALLLGLTKNIPRCDRAVKEGHWTERRELIRDNIELNGKTHGIVGLGRIGSRVAARCKAFGMRVLYFKRNRDLDLERSLGIEYVPFETLVRESDSISLHAPLTPETMNLFDAARFRAMKRTAFLINQSRGKVVNEEALIQALREGIIGGYATDVYESEPPDPKGELFRFKNVVAAPHLGGVTRESRIRSSMAVAEEVIKVIRGGIPRNVVNTEVLKKRLV